MSAPIPPVRRVLCAAVAVTVAAIAFRAPLADAVVTRGDDALRGGDADRAIRAYERALWLDPASVVAADRLAFHLAVRHTPAAAHRAASVASAGLAKHPAHAGLFADRALAELQLHEWDAAGRDFSAAAALSDDARYPRFARRMAERAAR